MMGITERTLRGSGRSDREVISIVPFLLLVVMHTSVMPNSLHLAWWERYLVPPTSMSSAELSPMNSPTTQKLTVRIRAHQGTQAPLLQLWGETPHLNIPATVALATYITTMQSNDRFLFS